MNIKRALTKSQFTLHTFTALCSLQTAPK